MKRLTILCLLALPMTLVAQLDRSVRPTAQPAPTINIHDSQVFTTANGITVVLSENHTLPRVSMNLVMGSNPRSEGTQAGLSEIAGSLIMSGTSNRSKDELDNAVDYIGASLSADANSLSLSCLTKHLPKGLELMSDVLLNANFPEAEVARIISKSESELVSAKSDPGTMARNAEAVANFPKGHPYGEIMTEGTLAAINREAIVNYYRQTFTPEGSYLVVVGDITKEQVLSFADHYFSKWSGGNVYKTNHGTGQFNTGNRVIFVKKPGAVQSVVYVSFPLNITPGHPDYLKLTVLNEILGGGVFGSRLMQNLREDKAYTYGCRSSLRINEDGSWFSAGGNFRNDVTDSAIREIIYEIKGMTLAEVTDEEINLTKSSMAGGFARSLERPSTVARFALNIIRNNLPKDYYQTYLKQLEAITKKDLLDVAQRYFLPEACNIVVVGNEEILPRLEPFDADGNIEKLDAFGQPVKEVIAADISADVLLERYITAVTKTGTIAEATKKINAVKSCTQLMELTMPQMPFPMTSTRLWVAPGTEVDRIEANGMVFQTSYFDGKSGYESNMQEGKKTMEAEEIAARKKNAGLFPELNYVKNGMTYEIKGIERKNGTDCYVIRTFDGKSEGFDYYDKSTYYKVASVSIKKEGDETQEISMNFGDFKEFQGMLFPTSLVLSVGQATFNGKVTKIELNGTVDLTPYK